MSGRELWIATPVLASIAAPCKPFSPDQLTFVVSGFHLLRTDRWANMLVRRPRYDKAHTSETSRKRLVHPEEQRTLLCLRNELNCLIYAVSLAKSLNWFSLKARLERPSVCWTPNCWLVWKGSWIPWISEGLELFNQIQKVLWVQNYTSVAGSQQTLEENRPDQVALIV